MKNPWNLTSSQAEIESSNDSSEPYGTHAESCKSNTARWQPTTATTVSRAVAREISAALFYEI